jgi:hypothetical protein
MVFFEEYNMNLNYIRYGQDGTVVNVGLEVSNSGTSFINHGNMAFIGTEARYRIYSDLLQMATALNNAGHPVTGYDLLVEDFKIAAHLFDEYQKAKDIP